MFRVLQHFTGLRRRLILSYLLVAFIFSLTVSLGLQFITYSNNPAVAIPSKNVIISFLLIMVPAGIISILSGILISRGITYRLHRLASAAHAWSQGAFHVAVQDSSQDELGQLAQDLNSMAEQIRLLLTTQQELAVVDERQRLARDLHDSIKQQLFVLTLLVGTARSLINNMPQAEQMFREIEKLASQIHRELTTLIGALRPVALDKGLNTALREHLQFWSQSTGISAQLHLADNLMLPSNVEQILFRIVQESLSNVARHSGASNVEVALSKENRHVLLIIKDDGHGFDPAGKKEHGVGLKSMQERIDMLGGQLRIFSNTAGTTIEARIALLGKGAKENETTNYATHSR